MPPKRKRSSQDQEGEGEYDFNWYRKGYVSGSLDQGRCGACARFVACDLISSSNAIVKNDKNLKRTRLSVQQLLDCCIGEISNGCMDGDVGECLQWAQEHGMHSAEDYPYESKVDTNPKPCRCEQLEGKSVVPGLEIDDVETYKNITNEQLIALVNKYPVGAVIDAYMLCEQRKMKRIWSGLHDRIYVKKEQAHAVLIVGHGRTKDGRRYWNVKSSWGSKVGDNGFYRIEFDTCDINEIIYECIVSL